MRVGFAGTPAFAAQALGAIMAAGLDVPLVLTQPDRPKGRGLKAESSPVRCVAEGAGVRVLQPVTLKSEGAQAELLAVPLDVLVVAAYGLILPPDVLAWPRFGCLNIHASKLPRWRGAAPIQRAIEAGDTETGVTIMQMEAGLDSGPMIEVANTAISPRETAGSLHDKLAASGAQVIVEVLLRLARDRALPSTPQPATGVTYARKIARADAVIDWGRPAESIDRQIRAFNPVPGAAAAFAGGGVKVWRAEPVTVTGEFGAGHVCAVTKDGIDVACGQGALRLLELQPASGKRMTASAFAAGHGVTRGSVFAAP
jgi:methionyl-tRNA formyltransferase